MKCSLIIVEDAKGNLSVPVIDTDKNAVLAMLPEILREGVQAHYIKNPTARTFRYKGKTAAQTIAENNAAYAEQDDATDELGEAPKRRGRPPKV